MMPFMVFGLVLDGVEVHERMGVRNYELVVKSLRWNGPAQMERALKNIPMQDAVVADFGAGTGQLSEIFRWYAAREIIAIDAVPGFLAHVKQQGLADRVVLADLAHEKVALPDESVDIAVASGLFSYIAQPDNLIAEMLRVTRTGGHVLFNFHPSAKVTERTQEQMPASALAGGKAAVYYVQHHSPVELTAKFAMFGTDQIYKNTTTQGVLRARDETWIPLTTCALRKTGQPSRPW